MTIEERIKQIVKDHPHPDQEAARIEELISALRMEAQIEYLHALQNKIK